MLLLKLQLARYGRRRAEVLGRADLVGSTALILETVVHSDGGEFIIGTENGITERLSAAAAGRRVYSLRKDFLCAGMKKITLSDLRDSLLEMKYEITVPDSEFAAARRTLERMMELG